MTTRVKKSAILISEILGYTDLSDLTTTANTDCASVINTALATGLPLYIPPGTWITSPIIVPASAFIFGFGNTSILKAKAASASALLTCGSGTTIKDLALDGNKASLTGSNKHGLVFSDAVKSAAMNLTISNTLADGINITGTASLNIRISNCDITGFTKNGITIENGATIYIDQTYCNLSDAVASPGDGISLAPTSGAGSVSLVTITGGSCKSNIGRGISVLGNTTKNVSDVTINGVLLSANSSHGFHALTAKQVLVTGCIAKSNLADGFRLEGDTVDSRVLACIGELNTTFGFREVVLGSTPNRNSFIYSVSTGNGTDTVTKVGANSSVIAI